jgi:hypothetical protein
MKNWFRYANQRLGKGLDDWDDEEEELGSSDDLKDCQGGREVEIPYGQEDSELRSTENLKDWHEDSQETLHCQLGNERRSDEDLEDCQEGSESIEDCQEGSGSMLNCRVGRGEKLRLSESLMDSMESSIQQELLMKMGSVDLMVCQGSNSRNIPYFQVGRDEQRNLDQPEELTEQMSSQRDQQVQLTEVKEHQGDILMIGGIRLFLPSAQEEAENSVVHAATAGERSQLMMTDFHQTVTGREEEELEQAFETAQADERKNECSEEQLNNFSQQAERAVALKLTAKAQAEQKRKMSIPRSGSILSAMQLKGLQLWSLQ